MRDLEIQLHQLREENGLLKEQNQEMVEVLKREYEKVEWEEEEGEQVLDLGWSKLDSMKSFMDLNFPGWEFDEETGDVLVAPQE